jgi:hypothetical protein
VPPYLQVNLCPGLVTWKSPGRNNASPMYIFVSE